MTLLKKKHFVSVDNWHWVACEILAFGGYVLSNEFRESFTERKLTQTKYYLTWNIVVIVWYTSIFLRTIILLKCFDNYAKQKQRNHDAENSCKRKRNGNHAIKLITLISICIHLPIWFLTPLYGPLPQEVS